VSASVLPLAFLKSAASTTPSSVAPLSLSVASSSTFSGAQLCYAQLRVLRDSGMKPLSYGSSTLLHSLFQCHHYSNAFFHHWIQAPILKIPVSGDSCYNNEFITGCVWLFRLAKMPTTLWQRVKTTTASSAGSGWALLSRWPLILLVSSPLGLVLPPFSLQIPR